MLCDVGYVGGGVMATRLAAKEIAALDPYKFMAVIGKRVIHPGGRSSTESLLRRAQITDTTRVLDVGCGVATTAVEIAKRELGHVICYSEYTRGFSLRAG